MTLRHTPTVVFWSLPATLFAVVGVGGPILALALAPQPSAGHWLQVVLGLINLAPLVLLWRTRVRLEPGAVVVVNGLHTHRVPVEEIADAHSRRWGLAAWRTLVERRDGTVLQLWGLTASKLGPGLAGRAPPSSLVRRLLALRAHAGLPNR